MNKLERVNQHVRDIEILDFFMTGLKYGNGGTLDYNLSQLIDCIKHDANILQSEIKQEENLKKVDPGPV